MADRTLSVKLLADIQGYVTGMDRVASKTRETTRSVEQNLADQRRKFEQVGAAAMAIGGLAALGIGAAIARYAEFDQAMSNVQAATHETTENMGLLREAALEAGASTVFSATEAAAAIEELSKAGVATADILSGGLQGALDLAAAGGIGVAEAAETAASAMTQFGLAGDEVTHIADLLAAGAGKAQGGVSEMGQALNQAGLVASQMGLSIEDTVGSLTAFASAGLIGSDAGTSFRAMLLRLANPTDESARLMDELGLAFYDAQGAFIGIEGLAGQLQERLGGLTEQQRNAALAQIFGQDAIRTSAILYEQGAEGVREWTDAVDDQGYAAETAATRLDNLRGDLEALSGAFETALIGVGEGSDGALRGLVQGLTDLVEAFTELPASTQQAVGVLGGLVAVVGLVGGGALVAVPQIVAFRSAIQTLGISAGVASTALSGLGIAAAGLGLAISAGFALEETKPKLEEWAEAVERGATAADLLTLSNKGALNSLDGFEFDTTRFGDYADQLLAIRDNTAAAFDPANYEVQFSDFGSRIREMDEQLSQLSPEDARAGFDALVEGMGLTYSETAQLRELMSGTVSVMGDAESSAEGAADGIEGVGEEAETAHGRIEGMLEAQGALNDLWFAAEDAAAAFEQQLIDIDEAFREAAENNESLAATWDATRNGFDLGTQAGIDAHTMLSDVVDAGNAHIQTLVDQNASSEELADAQARVREEVEQVANRFDSSGEAADVYSAKINDIPDTAITDVSVETAAAEAELAALTRTRYARVIASVVSDGQSTGFGSAAYAGVSVARASGGIIPGPPSSTDNIIAALATGEYVVNAAMTSRYLPLLEAINSGRLPGYATGGYVRSGYMQAAPVVNVTGGGGGAPIINQTVQPAPGMSEAAFAQKSASVMAWALQVGG